MHVGLRQADGGDRVDTLGRFDTVGAFSDGVLDISEGDEYFAGGASYMPGVAAGDTHIGFDGTSSGAHDTLASWSRNAAPMYSV